MDRHSIILVSHTKQSKSRVKNIYLYHVPSSLSHGSTEYIFLSRTKQSKSRVKNIYLYHVPSSLSHGSTEYIFLSRTKQSKSRINTVHPCTTHQTVVFVLVLVSEVRDQQCTSLYHIPSSLSHGSSHGSWIVK